MNLNLLIFLTSSYTVYFIITPQVDFIITSKHTDEDVKAHQDHSRRPAAAATRLHFVTSLRRLRVLLFVRPEAGLKQMVELISCCLARLLRISVFL